MAEPDDIAILQDQHIDCSPELKENMWEVAHMWMSTCRERHQECQRPSPDFCPTRLVDTGNDMLQLVEKEDVERPIYAALSYCWGGNNAGISQDYVFDIGPNGTATSLAAPHFSRCY